MKYEEIKIGAVYSFDKKITKEDVLCFAELVGDYNQIHVDKKYGRSSLFGQNIVHGMLAGSLFSTLVGMYCPGENGLYLSQTLNFRYPIFFNDLVCVMGEVISKSDSIKVITLKTQILKDNIVVIDGEAKVKLLI